MMRADGTRVRRLAHDSYCYDNAAWSPDGRRMAFLRYRTGGLGSKYSIWAMNVDGTGLRRLTNGNRDHDPAWSPDGMTIAFARNYPEAIWLMNADGSDQRQLTTPRQDTDSGDEEDFGPDWSPNSKWIAFSRVHEPHMGRTGGTRYRIDIYVIGTDGTGLRRLTRLAGMNSWPAWSPDGRRIVFESDRSHEDLSDIYVMNGDGTRQTRLTKGPVIHESPDWRPRP